MKRLYRSIEDRKIAGICGGIGEMLEVDPTLVRLITIVLAISTAIFPTVIVYFVSCLFIPNAVPKNTHVKDGAATG
ncbi:MAG: PspC domain-containing protein [candidate division Zixibacteria bacterium]